MAVYHCTWKGISFFYIAKKKNKELRAEESYFVMINANFLSLLTP